MSKVYFISGLGADWRMFQFLKLPRYWSQQQVEWMEPLHLDEPLPDYVQRLQVQITTPGPILVGLSFGGVVAIELAKILQPRKVILISSLATRHALPWYYRVAGKTRMQRWMPMQLMKNIYPLAPLFFGAHTRPEKKLLKEVILDMDEKFLRWSLGQLLAWPQQEVLPDLVQIHGTADLVLPLHDRPDIIKVQGGEHLMVMHRAEEISAILSKILEDDMPNSKFIVTLANGEQVDLTQATILKSNNLYPFGQHNYAIYETPEGVFVKGLNKGEREIMLTHFELIDEATARSYSHPYLREDE
ncbi:alpha/beta hydrolase [Pontibacter rufus]|uniref:alpha/beta hydrolase n=1 Tax=Pontibacter rufus TaxID=2791028 RepID=UPI001E63679F|nr:alpha/beta hydrolase [Pontibacter sp. 172403-2]